jgi:uncharacterized membrane protein
MSFLTLGIFWVGQQAQLSTFTRSDRALTWIHLTFLLTVTLMPFSTGLLAEDTTYRLASPCTGSTCSRSARCCSPASGTRIGLTC